MKAFCNITGIEFEQTSARQKNHPKVSELLSDINRRKDGTYKIIKENIEARKGTFADFQAVKAFANSEAAKKENREYEDRNTDAAYY